MKCSGNGFTICTVSLQFSFVIHNANFDTAQLNWTFGDTFLCGYVCKCKGKVHLVLVQDAIDKRSYRTIDNFLTIMSNFCTLNRNVSGLIKMQNHMIFFLLFPAPSKIGCTFPAWMQSKKSWSSIDSAFVWKFSGAAGNSTWRNNTKLATSENNFVNHEESQVWCHKIQEQLVEEEENDSDRIRSRRNHQKIILYATSGW